MLERTGVLTIGLIAVIGASGCRRGHTDAHGATPTTAKRPNVIFLTVDTLRADHLGLYGYDRPTMPWLDEFATEAVVFDNAVVPRGSTRASYASMLTGLYPYRHGARSNRLVLHEDNRTLAEVLKTAGYRTGAFVSNFVLVAELSGCDQGFDVYDDRLTDKELFRTNYERSANQTADAILSWLENDPPQPFFLFTNFIDPHGPYLPPDKYRKQFQSGKTKSLDPGVIPDYQSRAGERADLYDFIDRYDAEIRYTNDAIERVVAGLKSKGIWENSIVVFTADHGESLGMHGLYFEHHFHVWEETTRVPLAIKLPGDWTMEGRRVTEAVSPMDLMPTVLGNGSGWVGIDPPTGMDGVDLTPLMKGVDVPARSMFVEFPSVASPARNPFPDVWAIRTATHKLIMVTDIESGATQQKALYNLRDDPNEQHPLPLDGRHGELKQLTTDLADHVSRVRRHKLPFVVTEYEVPIKDRPEFVRRSNKRVRTRTLTDEQVDRLRGLGYVK